MNGNFAAKKAISKVNTVFWGKFYCENLKVLYPAFHHKIKTKTLRTALLYIFIQNSVIISCIFFCYRLQFSLLCFESSCYILWLMIQNTWYFNSIFLLCLQPTIDSLPQIVTLSVTTGIAFLVAICVQVNIIFQKIAFYLALCVWLCLLCLVFIPMVLVRDTSTMDHVAIVMCIIVFLYTMMPLNKVQAIVAGAVTSVAHLVAEGILADKQQDCFSSQVWKVSLFVRTSKYM